MANPRRILCDDKTQTRNATRLICGFGRCGTSLALQMLAAAGHPVAGDWPDYEPPECGHSVRIRPDVWARMQGRTLKILDPHIYQPPITGYVRAVWLSRDYDIQAASQAKFGHMLMGLPNDRQTRRAYARSYAKDEPAAKGWLQRQIGGPLPIVRFEDMILHPERAANALCVALDLVGLNIPAMVAQVRPRDVGCYPGLIEAELLRDGAPPIGRHEG